MQGKVAVITGAAKGLGRGFSETLLKHGCKVVLSDVDGALGEKSTETLGSQFGAKNTLFQQCDVTIDKDMTQLFKKAKSTFGQIDLVVNNAGICHEGKWETMLNINLLGAIRGTWLGLEYMGKDKGGQGGSIVNIASVSGLHPTIFAPSYSASKAGLISFSQSLAANRICRDNNIRINCFCPFFTETDILKFSEDTVIGTKIAQKSLEVSGVMPLTRVTDEFMRLVKSDDLNGEVLLVSMTGSKFVSPPSLNDLVQGCE